MLGIYRTALALMVVLTHLGGVHAMGHYAVFGFFIVSGYLMTLIVNESYGYSRNGFLRYVASRFLRIFPSYWVAAALSLLLIFILGQWYTRHFHRPIQYPDNIVQTMQNLFLVLGHRTPARLVPPTWALTVELCYYLLIGLGISRTRKITLLWFGFGVLYTVIRPLGEEWSYRYFHVAAASLPFSTGALIYHFSKPILTRANALQWPACPLFIFGAILFNYSHRQSLDAYDFYSPFYGNLALNALMVLSLAHRTGMFGISPDQDKRIGDLSYPIYLLHYQAGLILVGLGLPFSRGDMRLALTALPLLLLLAYLLNHLVQQPVDRWRARLRHPRHPPP